MYHNPIHANSRWWLAHQVSIFDSTSTRDQDQQQRDLRKYYNGDAGAGRQDNQERRGDLRESSYNRQDSQVSAFISLLDLKVIMMIVDISMPRYL